MNVNKLLHTPNIGGQSLVDRVTAAKHSLAGEGLAKSICKATTEEPGPPKKKHIDTLIRCTHEPNVSVPQMAGLLIDRTHNASWVIVFKSLITAHTLINYGNERFIQYLASNNCTFNMENYTDKTTPLGYDMSPFIRRYAKYLNAKALSYRHMAYDFCKIKKGKEDGVLRIMDTETLLRALPVLQAQVDSLLEFDATKNDLTNSIINAGFLMMFKDLIRLLACYNDAVINLLAKYFTMSRKQCKEALDLYKKFVLRMELVAKLLAVAESVGIDKGDIPDLAQAPSSLFDALESHLKSLETSRKASRSGSVVAEAIQNLSFLRRTATESVDESLILPPTNPFADLLESSTASVTPSDDATGHIAGSVAGAAQPETIVNNPFMSVVFGDVARDANLSKLVVTQEDPWANQNVSESNVSGFATAEQFKAVFGESPDLGTLELTEDVKTPTVSAPVVTATLNGLATSDTTDINSVKSTTTTTTATTTATTSSTITAALPATPPTTPTHAAATEATQESHVECVAAAAAELNSLNSAGEKNKDSERDSEVTTNKEQTLPETQIVESNDADSDSDAAAAAAAGATLDVKPEANDDENDDDSYLDLR